MPYARLGDVELFYTDDGAGAPPVLFVHGWTCDSHDWSWQFDAFSARHRVVAADNRGHGRSSMPGGGYRPRDFAADLAALIGELGLDPVVAIGHSLGGAIASALAVEHPELVRAVVAVDPAYGLTGQLAERVRGSLPHYRGPDTLSVTQATIEGMEGPHTPPALRSWHRRRAASMRPDVAGASYVGIWEGADQFGFRLQSDAYLARRRCPVLTITADAARGSWESETFRDPRSRLIVWEGCGHWLHQERPEEFNELVLDWIAGLDR